MCKLRVDGKVETECVSWGVDGKSRNRMCKLCVDGKGETECVNCVLMEKEKQIV